MKEQMIKLVKEVGLGVAAFCLMSWLVYVIMTNLIGSIDNLNNDMQKFTSRVEIEHEQGQRQHEKMIAHQEGMLLQQKELIVQQRQVTEALGRINGYR